MRSIFTRQFVCRSSPVTIRGRKRRADGNLALGVDALESRMMLAITPGQLYTDATYTDADGDTVEIRVTGAIDPAHGFTVELAGNARDNADATRINLVGLGGNNGLQIVVTPVEQPNAGPNFNKIYSAGYTNVATLSNIYEAGHAADPIAAIAGIQLSAAIVNKIDLGQRLYNPATDTSAPGVAIGSITLDAGQAPYVDRINTTNNQQAADSTMYQPVTGLIDLGGITAGSINSLVINGAISAPTGNPYDTSVTNDFRSVINVSGRIGSVIGLRSSLSGVLRADSIGSVRVASISGVIRTRNVAEDFSINLPSHYKGFISSAGHLNLGFPMGDGALITGQINSAGGISGSDQGSSDTIHIPGTWIGSLSNTSAVRGIADIAVDGEAAFTLASASDIGALTADAFAAMTVNAAGSIGPISASVGSMEGHFAAGNNLGDIHVVKSMLANLVAGKNIGSVTSVAGGIESLSIQAGGDIGPIWVYSGVLGTSIVAGGNLGQITAKTGGVTLSFLRANNIAGISVVDGNLADTSLVATQDIGEINTFGSISQNGIANTSIVAGRDIAAITGQTHAGLAIDTLKVEAGRTLAGVTGISFGQFGTLDGAGIVGSNFVARDIGAVYGRSAGGWGIDATRVVTRTVSGTASGRIDSIVGEGWLDGLRNVVAVAHTDIGLIRGTSIVTGNGISGGSFDANYGDIGQILAHGGADGGDGIARTRFQATDDRRDGFGVPVHLGRIGNITTSANANGVDAMFDVTVHAGSIGAITATVHGGVRGSGIVLGEIRAFNGAIDLISVDVRSTAGQGMRDAIVKASGDIGPLSVTAFNGSGIVRGEFQSRGNFGAITVESKKGGNGIEGAIFSAPGRIEVLPPSIPAAIPFPDTDSFDSKGNFSSITVISGGTDALSDGIVDTTFTAIGDIGEIRVTTKGGTAISRSTFTADSDSEYQPNPPVDRPWLANGKIAAITAVAAGRQGLSSSGIVDSQFNAAQIGTIYADVQTVEGGNAISRSTFTAHTAIHDGFGNFDDTGRIGDILVRNRASTNLAGIGIDTSNFVAGAAGAIGNISVTTNGGSGIVLSNFFANTIDLDQAAYTSTIGTITVDTGRTMMATFFPSAITTSMFTSAAGIGDVTVTSIGTGITASSFIANFDWLSFDPNLGNLGKITVNVKGRFGSAVSASAFLGSNIGDIYIRLNDNAAQGINAVALSTFQAHAGRIGNVTVIHSQRGLPYAIGLGNAILMSSWNALSDIGNIDIQGRANGAVFTVSGQPQLRQLQLARSFDAPANSIGAISLTSSTDTSATFQTPGEIGPVTVRSNAGAMTTLILNGSSVGAVTVQTASGTSNLTINSTAMTLSDVTVNGSLALTAGQATTMGNLSAGTDLTVTAGRVQTIGNLTSGGNASLAMGVVINMGNIAVGGVLSLPQSLANVVKVGSFSAGSLAKVTKAVQIGARTAYGTSIGAVRINALNTGKGLYRFAFAAYGGTPNAVVGIRTVNKVTITPVTIGGVNFVKTTVKPPALKMLVVKNK